MSRRSAGGPDPAREAGGSDRGRAPSPTGIGGSRFREARHINQSASSLQANPRKTKKKRLYFFGFLWPNLAFSMGYREKNKKNRRGLNSRSRLRVLRPAGEKDQSFCLLNTLDTLFPYRKYFIDFYICQ
jgi:hypothetical protein